MLKAMVSGATLSAPQSAFAAAPLAAKIASRKEQVPSAMVSPAVVLTVKVVPADGALGVETPAAASTGAVWAGRLVPTRGQHKGDPEQ